jgi:hypothetical protein
MLFVFGFVVGRRPRSADRRDKGPRLDLLVVGCAQTLALCPACPSPAHDHRGRLQLSRVRPHAFFLSRRRHVGAGCWNAHRPGLPMTRRSRWA